MPTYLNPIAFIIPAFFAFLGLEYLIAIHKKKTTVFK
jgi:hypothetical protein